MVGVQAKGAAASAESGKVIFFGQQPKNEK